MKEPWFPSESSIGKIKIKECGEPLVNLAYYCLGIKTSLDSDIQLKGIPKGVRLVRKGFALKIAKVQEGLSPYGYRLVVHHTYRTPEHQKQEWEESYKEFKEKHPELSHRQLVILTNRYVSPVGKGYSPAHPSGGSGDFDFEIDGDMVDLGYKMDELSERCSIYYKNLTPEQNKHRIVIMRVIKKNGLTQYPLEFWHVDYNNALWAACSGRRVALYGTIDSVEWAREHNMLELKSL